MSPKTVRIVTSKWGILLRRNGDYSTGADSRGVFGFATAVSGGAITGVWGDAASSFGRGVFGRALATSGETIGVYGQALSPQGVAVRGQGLNGARAGLFDGNVQINGNLTVTGTKSFARPHPTQRGKEIVYIALEGPEAGTYIRGTARLIRGQAVVDLPEHFALVTADQGLTVQLTPVGSWLQLYVHQQSPQRLIVREAQGKSGRFHYLVQGIRRGYAQHQVIRDKAPTPVAMATRGR